MDRLTSMGISNASKDFLDAAKVIYGKDPTVSQPLYFLLCQSIELSLKAFLRGAGYSEKQLRRIGHDLLEASEYCKRNGLNDLIRLTREEEQAIYRINPYYLLRDLQYITTGYKSYPLPEILIRLADRLWTSTRDYCVKMREFHEGKTSEVS